MPKVAVVTGAGSGVGRATAIKLVQQGWQVALLGRTEEALRATATLTAKPDACVVSPLRIGDLEGTNKLGQSILSRFSRIDLLVNAAGTNIPQRSLEVLSNEDYHEMLDTNLNGA
ncbi:MAG TPA: SDR family oxidoreductase, partial [Verrucomicrobiae bacterium]|nr:SDR family oxidoreductase [Verrucomicrobiae bacterium]